MFWKAAKHGTGNIEDKQDNSALRLTLADIQKLDNKVLRAVIADRYGCVSAIQKRSICRTQL